MGARARMAEKTRGIGGCSAKLPSRLARPAAPVLDESALAMSLSWPRARVGMGSSLEGVLAELARGSGAVARRTALPGGLTLADHVHDFPYLSLHVLGAYREHGDGAEVRI